MKIAFFCVNYNSTKELLGYLDSIEKAYTDKSHHVTVIVTDNSQNQSNIKSSYSFSFSYIFSGKNLGYLGGITYGIKKSGLNLAEFDYIIISNVDIKIEETFFSKLFQMKIAEDIGCIAPSIISSKEKCDRNPEIIQRTSRNKLNILRIMYKHPLIYLMYRNTLYRWRRSKVQKYPRGYIYAPHGSFMIFTNRFAKFLQLMRYPVFLFGEEIYFAENLRTMNLRVLYEPQLIIDDYDHVSTNKLKKQIYYELHYKAIDMLIREYFHE